MTGSYTGVKDDQARLLRWMQSYKSFGALNR